MLYTSINACFLDLCLHSFLESHFYKSAYEPFLPLTYETSETELIQAIYREVKPEATPGFLDGSLKLFTQANTNSPDWVSCNYKATESKLASYTGFMASFYQDGQLKIFGYAISGKIINYPISEIISYFVALKQGQEKIHSSYLIRPHHSFGERYENGKSIHSPYI